jgi:hypothetical protein
MVPSFVSLGGPFAGKRFLKQKIISNYTMYLAYRDTDGKYLDADKGILKDKDGEQEEAKIQLKFEM